MNRFEDALTDAERAQYAWQMTVPGVGESGQLRLKSSTVLVSRCGGVGGSAAQQLAAAGVGRLILLHGGDLQPADLNRQILMRADALGHRRVDCAAARLREINSHVEVVSVAEYPNQENCVRLAAEADLVISAAPLFEERHALHRAAAERGIPCVEAAMYAMQGYVTVVHPPHTARYDEWVPEKPDWWKRQFPVFGAVSGVIGALAAVEAIKLLTGIGQPLYNQLLAFDFLTTHIRSVQLPR